jgi:RNA polymerase sigma factor (sigma-70 family)
MMSNPFAEQHRSDAEDRELVASAVHGSRSALEELILRHQAWIFNIAIRMVGRPADAEDVTQEILIKVITSLSGFQGRSSFRTWLYRVVANHVINMRKRKAEMVLRSFAQYGRGIDSAPDLDLPDPSTMPVDTNLIVEETKLGCMMGMLLCLDRKHRLVFILGSIFGVTDRLGSEVMGISKDAFRQRLSRSRRRLSNFMNEKCGLIREENPCHCARKTTALIKSGEIDPHNLRFSGIDIPTVRAVAQTRVGQLDDFLEAKCEELFRENPFHEPPDYVQSFQELLNSPRFKEIFNFVN